MSFMVKAIEKRKREGGNHGREMGYGVMGEVG